MTALSPSGLTGVSASAVTMLQQQDTIEGGQALADFMASQPADAPVGASNDPARVARATRAGRRRWRMKVGIGSTGTQGMLLTLSSISYFSLGDPPREGNGNDPIHAARVPDLLSFARDGRGLENAI
jgi:hypothetical protein